MTFYYVIHCNKAAALCARTPEATQQLHRHTIIPEPKRWSVNQGQETPTRRGSTLQNTDIDSEWDAGDMDFPNVARMLGA